MRVQPPGEFFADPNQMVCQMRVPGAVKNTVQTEAQNIGKYSGLLDDFDFFVQIR